MSERRWIETKGRKPRTGEALLHLKFRNGHESLRPYIANLIRWNDTGGEWDVVACARVSE